MNFVNPTRNQTDIWVQEGLREEISRSSRLFEEKKFSPQKAAGIADQLDPQSYVEYSNTVELESGGELPNIESLTAENKIYQMLEESNVTSISWGINEVGEKSYPASGPIQIETRSATEEDAYQFWIPFVDEKRGEIAGIVQPPYNAPEPFVHSIENPYRTDSWVEEDAIEMAYVAAREMIPEVKPDYTGNFDVDWFHNNILRSSAADMIRELEEEGEVTVGSNEYIGQQRGGNATNALQKI